LGAPAVRMPSWADGKTPHRHCVGRMNMRYLWAVLAAAILVAGILAVQGARRQTEQTAAEVDVEAYDYRFSPETIQVRAGSTVTVRLRNQGVEHHNWAAPELNVATPDIPSGSEAVIEFTPGRPGTYEIVCTVPGHRQLGMVGKLVVTAP